MRRWLLPLLLVLSWCTSAVGQATQPTARSATRPSDADQSWDSVVTRFASSLFGDDARGLESLLSSNCSIRTFQRAIQRGEVRPDADIDTAVQWLGGLLAVRAVTGREMPDLDEVPQLVEFTLRGVLA